MSLESTSSKERKIKAILGLLSGDIKPEDINPKCVIMIGYGENNTYLVNGKQATKEAYDKTIETLEPTSFNITYGEYDIKNEDEDK